MTAGDNRAWSAVKATLSGAALTGVPGVTLAIPVGQSLDVDINRASGLKGTTAAVAANWDKAFATHLTAGGQTFDATDAHTRASGTATVNLFDFVSGTVGFAFETRSVDVDLTGDNAIGAGDLTGAKLTTLFLSVQDLQIGTPDIGFHVTSGSVAVASIASGGRGGRPGRPALVARGLRVDRLGDLHRSRQHDQPRGEQPQPRDQPGLGRPRAPGGARLDLGAAPERHGRDGRRG